MKPDIKYKKYANEKIIWYKRYSNDEVKCEIREKMNQYEILNIDICKVINPDTQLY